MFLARFMPCSECGESVERSTAPVHRCRSERLVEYQLFGLRDGIAEYEAQLGAYLHTVTGRFEVWLAGRQVRHGVH